MDIFSNQTVKDIGEQGLLKILQSFCPSEVIGDDAAILKVPVGYSLVVTTDVLVQDVHFSARTTSPEDVGWRSAAANLSDLAAMGATPLGITVGLGLPGETSVDWIIQMYQGMADCLKQYQTVIVGGDICRSPVVTVSITALGLIWGDRAIRRFSAQPGDAIVITGSHGLSRAGLELLLHPESGQHLAANCKDLLRRAHQRPQPRLDVLEMLWNLTDAAAGMDSSDGLADAVLQICRCSQVGARIDRSAIPLHSALTQFVGTERALEWALYGGEDFELVLCLPVKIAEAFTQQMAPDAAIIGQITEIEEVKLIDRKGEHSEGLLSLEAGYQHF
jgi:thiamine-monophosphate kinase